MSLKRNIVSSWIAAVVLFATLVFHSSAAAADDAAVNWNVTEVKTSTPYRIFYEGEDIHLTVRVETQLRLGKKVRLIARQFHRRMPEDQPKDVKAAALGKKGEWDNVPGPAFPAGKAAVQRDGNTLVLNCKVQIERLGAIRLLLEHDKQEHKLADFLHVLPLNGVKPDEAVISLSSSRRPEHFDERLGLYKRLGFQVIRDGASRYKRGTDELDMAHLEPLLTALRKHDMRVNFVVGQGSSAMRPRMPGHDRHSKESVVRYNRGRKPESTPGTAYLDVWAERVGEVAAMFKGYARSYEFFNEPWETGSISATISGGAHIRRLIAWGAPAIKKADPNAKIAAACSTQNALDSFLPYPKTTELMDVLSIHTYTPGSAGAYLAPKYGLEIWDTESWEPMMERNLPIKIAHQIHEGYGCIKPMKAFDMPENNPRRYTHSPFQANAALVVTAQRMLEGMKPAGYGMKGRIPIVLLYRGRGHAAAFIHNTFEYYGTKFFRPTPQRQLELNDDCTDWGPYLLGHFIVPEKGLTVRDVYGNKLSPEDGVYRIPLGQSGTYVTANNLERLRTAMESGTVEDMKPFTIAVRDITERLAPESVVRVEVTNVYPVKKTATVSLDGHQVLQFADQAQTGTIPASGTATFSFPIKTIAKHQGNAFRVTARVQNENKNYSYTETINVAVIARGTITIDGDLSDWDKTHAVPVRLSNQGAESDPTAEYQYLPMNFLSEKEAESAVLAARAAWDDDYFYFASEVVDATENRRESNAYGQRHDTYAWPNQQVYLGAHKIVGRAGDLVMLSFNTNEDHKKHWDFPGPDHPLAGLLAYPDTDFEFEIYPVKYNERRDNAYKRAMGRYWQGYPKSDVWRLYDPKMTFRHHAYPLNLPSTRQKYDQNLVPGARSVVKRQGGMWIYEVAIPWSQIWEVKPEPGKRVKFTFYTRDGGRHALEYARNKSVSGKQGCMTFHPLWERNWTNETEWGFVE